jgi:hypothetical protein
MAMNAGHPASAEKAREMFRKKTHTRIEHRDITRNKTRNLKMDGARWFAANTVTQILVRVTRLNIKPSRFINLNQDRG